MSNVVSYNNVQDKIVQLNGQDVILDYAVAELYGVETKRINEAVRNNPDKFPSGGYILELDIICKVRSSVVKNFDLRTGIRKRTLLQVQLQGFH